MFTKLGKRVGELRFLKLIAEMDWHSHLVRSVAEDSYLFEREESLTY